METDLKKIEQMAISNEDENWRFRNFLKRSDMSLEEMDALVHGINDRVSAGIDCTECANCCIVFSPVFTAGDIKKMSRQMGLTSREFESRFLEEDNEEQAYIVQEAPCPFLKNKLCSQYDGRPEGCSSFPHLDQDDFVFRLTGVLEKYSICPIVFNVYDILKNEIWTDRGKR